MKRASEIIHIVPEEEKEKYLKKYVNPSEKVAEILWKCGIRKQFYYEFGGDILRTYEYTGKNFGKDMDAVSENKETEDFFMNRRRKDVPEEKRMETCWWAPMKWCGSSVMSDPVPDDEEEMMNMVSGSASFLDGNMMIGESSDNRDYIYNEDDWSESVHM